MTVYASLPDHAAVATLMTHLELSLGTLVEVSASELGAVGSAVDGGVVRKAHRVMADTLAPAASGLREQRRQHQPGPRLLGPWGNALPWGRWPVQLADDELATLRTAAKSLQVVLDQLPPGADASSGVGLGATVYGLSRLITLVTTRPDDLEVIDIVIALEKQYDTVGPLA